MQDILLEFWHHKAEERGDFHAKCFLWCTPDGKPPISPQDSLVPSQLAAARPQGCNSIDFIDENLKPTRCSGFIEVKVHCLCIDNFHFASPPKRVQGPKKY